MFLRINTAYQILAIQYRHHENPVLTLEILFRQLHLIQRRRIMRIAIWKVWKLKLPRYHREDVDWSVLRTSKIWAELPINPFLQIITKKIPQILFTVTTLLELYFREVTLVMFKEESLIDCNIF